MEVFEYRVTITGRVQAENRQEAQDKIRAGLVMSVPMHESVDSFTIVTKSDMQELRERFPG